MWIAPIHSDDSIAFSVLSQKNIVTVKTHKKVWLKYKNNASNASVPDTSCLIFLKHIIPIQSHEMVKCN